MTSEAPTNPAARGNEPAHRLTYAELKQADARGMQQDDGGTQPDPTGYGIGVRPVSPEQAQALDIPAGRGVIIASVDGDGRAAAAGLREGDVIEEVDGSPVTSVERLRSLLHKGERPALVLVHRGDSTIFLTLERNT